MTITTQSLAIPAVKLIASIRHTDERGIRWDDPDLGIDWPGLAADPVVSARDQALPSFADWLRQAAGRLDHADSDNYDGFKKMRRTPSRPERASI